VAAYLQRQGYRIIRSIRRFPRPLGERAYANLRDVPGSVDIVNIFRRPETVPEVVEDAIVIHAGAVWMQLGVANEAAAQRARDAGIPVVLDKCIMVEHRAQSGD